MAVTKDPERGTWTVQCWYRDWQGARRKKTKRGFKSRASALAWERDFAARSAGAIDMRFGDFFDVFSGFFDGFFRMCLFSGRFLRRGLLCRCGRSGGVGRAAGQQRRGHEYGEGQFQVFPFHRCFLLYAVHELCGPGRFLLP